MKAFAGISTNAQPSRPVLRWHGGKWRLAPWIISHFPTHRTYVEPYGGAASVLLRKPRADSEIYNDLDHEAVNLFRMLRDPAASAELVRRVRLTPFARVEFEAAWDWDGDPVERARRLIVRSHFGYGSDGSTRDARRATTGFRTDPKRSHGRGTTPAEDWKNYPPALALIVERFAGVTIESIDALDVARKYDRPDTLHYVDPPYLPETRRMDHRDHGYRHELSAEDHARLLDALRALGGMVVLSGYPSAIYDRALPGWEHREIATFADGARPRTECLWINPACVEALGHGPLFRSLA